MAFMSRRSERVFGAAAGCAPSACSTEFGPLVPAWASPGMNWV